jgi:recombination protein RecT
MGLLDLAIASGSIMWGQAEMVYSNDRFHLNGFDKAPEHGRDPFDANRGDLVGVYVVVKTHSSDYLTTTMTLAEVEAIKARSESGKIGKGPWKTDFNEMAKKTVIKRAYKLWPKTDRLDAAIHHLNTVAGEGIDFNVPARGADWIDPEPLIARALQTTADAEALKFWKDNNAQLAKQPADHKKLKDAIASHRLAMKEAAASDAARTIDMPAASAKPAAASAGKPAIPAVPPQHESTMADLEAEAQNGTEAFDNMWNSLSPETMDDLADHLPRLQALAAGKK